MKTLLLDTETTDLVKNRLMPLDRQPRIIEFFGLSFDGDQEVKAIHRLINPGKRLTEEIIRITGIKDSDLIDKKPFADFANELAATIEEHDECVAHNMSFDRAMIDIEFKRMARIVRWPKLICTVEATEFIKGHRLNLMSLHEYLFGEPFTGAHRAETDVRAMARCFFELRKREIV
jgi:DNA polymerase-3 subunit epsilon